MTRGRPPKPPEMKRLLGNPGKRPLPSVVTALPMADGVPKPPDELGLDGLGLWKRAWEQGISWISKSSDLDELLEACHLKDDLALARERYRATRDPGDLRALVALSTALSAKFSALGFNPTARARLGVAEVKKANALEDLIARRTSG